MAPFLVIFNTARHTYPIMARSDGATKPEITNRDLWNALQGLGSRTDSVNTRVDTVIKGQGELSDKMVSLQTDMTGLRETTNERLHEIDANFEAKLEGIQGDVSLLKRPWELMQGGWKQLIATIAITSGTVGLIAKFWWPF